jgi:serine/threonine protein kinase
MVSGDDDDRVDRDDHDDHDDTVTLFRAKIDNKTVKGDYELQELLRTVHIYSINVEQLVLEPRFEDAIRNIPGASDIVKIKMRLLYIIISLNIYKGLFEEKKQYHSVKTTQYIGVFQYNNYIMRIDDTPYSFINENEVIAALREIPETNIIRPFLVYINKKHNFKNEICECSQAICDCKYYDNVDNHPDMDELPKESRRFYDKLRNNSVSFSIQHYVKDTQTLYNWVKDNIGNTIYKQFSTIQHPFFITLFERCAQLLCDIHGLSVVHGDIKPDNILIKEHSDFNINHPEKCKNFTVYLIDFGLSGIDGVGIGTGGTIPYCHPEFKNIRDTNKTSKYFWKTLQLKHDVWSLGIAFITMYIYHDFYNYYHKYPAYFFMNNGYVSSLIIGVVSHKKLNALFTKMLSDDCIPINEVSILLKEIMV